MTIVVQDYHAYLVCCFCGFHELSLLLGTSSPRHTPSRSDRVTPFWGRYALTVGIAQPVTCSPRRWHAVMYSYLNRMDGQNTGGCCLEDDFWAPGSDLTRGEPVLAAGVPGAREFRATIKGLKIGRASCRERVERAVV